MNLEQQVNFLLEKKSNKKKFFISDTHFDDDRLNLYGRDLIFKDAKECNEYIIKKWNEYVSENDLVIVLGDVSMTKEGLDNLLKCNGEKWLIRGNYDISQKDGGTAKYEINEKILSKYFSLIVDDMELNIGGEKVYLNHYPTNCKENQFCICGHIHGTFKVQRNMINVGVDAWHFVPVSEDLIKFQMNGIRNHYDQNVFAGELLSNLNNRKGEFKVLRAPEYNNVDFDDDMIIFLAGPIKGSKNWQEDFIEKFTKKIENVKLKHNVIIASPRRLEKTKEHFDDKMYNEQVDWESYYLNKSANQGCLVFWLAKESEKVKGRSYAQTTRFELGEWFGKGQNIDDFDILVGYEEGFDGVRYIENKMKKTYKKDLYKKKEDIIDYIIKNKII